MAWYRNNKAAVAEALRRGERPDLATTMASGPLDELVALHQELGMFAILDELEVQRERAGVPDDLLLRTLATLPFVEQASLSGASEVLFREPTVLLQLGWAPVQIRAGSNGRHRHPAGRQEESLPCHPDTLRDALRRIGESAWLRAQAAGVQALYQRQLVRGKVNTAQVYRLQAGERLAAVAIRRLRRLRQRELGSAPAVIYAAGCYGVFSLEELLEVLGSAPRESLLPAVKKISSPDAPT